MLNKRLYAALVGRFGKSHVRVLREDTPLRKKYVWQEENWRLKRLATGEEYQLRCPVCRDYKPRLSISYVWGRMDRKTGTRNLWLIQCWNEGCFSEYAARREFYDSLFEGKDDIQERELVERGERMPGEPSMPGKLYRLDRLYAKVPRHQAVLYAQRRLMNPVYLGERWGVGYCSDPWDPMAMNRLIVPVYCQGKFRGWTGRYMGGQEEDEQGPKWYHDPGMQKAQLWYNYDVARKHHTKFLLEGPGDVWSVGDQGMACLGKTFSPEQLDLLQKACEGEDFTLVVMLDPQQDKESQRKGKPHHIVQACKLLEERRRFRGHVLPVWLPAHLDPGETDRAFLYGYTRLVAAKAAMKVVLPEVK